jgi:hypothetical protein
MLTLTAVGASVTLPAAAQVAGAGTTADQQAGPAPLSEPRRTGAPGALTRSSLRLPGVENDFADLAIPVDPSADALRGQTVLARSRPNYDPVGINAGGFRILPQISLRTGYLSNVFRQTGGAGDVYGQVRGAVLAASNWSRHQALFEGFVDQRVYSRYSTENGLTYSVRGAGRLDITDRASISAGVQQGHNLVDRGATTELLVTRRPVRYDYTAADVGLRVQQGRFAFDLTGLASHSAFEDAETPAGLPLNQSLRDATSYRVQGEVGYASGAGPSLFVSVAADVRRFDDNVLRNRNSSGLEVLGGLRGDITPLIRGRVGIGYFRYDFADPAISARSGMGVDARVDYLITPLTTISMTARRELKNVSSINLPAALSTSFAAGVDHELLRNLVVSTGATFENADYVDSPLLVRRYGGHLGAFYLVNRRFRLDGDIAYRRRDGNSINTQQFGEVNASVGVTYRM